MFGTYDLNIELKEDDAEVRIDGKGKKKSYERKVLNEKINKIIFAEKGNVVICPVEPVNLPSKGVAEHLLIELNEPIIIEPYVKQEIYIKFPVEIGVFLVDKNDIERIDIFTKTKPKYILYGPPEGGIICRWWKSGIYGEMPEVDRLYEGIMKIEIQNSYYEWVEVKKMVFRAFDMKLFYDGYAYMHAYLRIIKKTMGETAFNNRKPKNMKRSIDIYLAKGIKKLEKKFVMEWGFE